MISGLGKSCIATGLYRYRNSLSYLERHMIDGHLHPGCRGDVGVLALQRIWQMPTLVSSRLQEFRSANCQVQEGRLTLEQDLRRRQG